MCFLCQDVVPALLHVLAPEIRPVAERLMQPNERAALADVTDSMLAYNLRYDAPLTAPVFGQQTSAPVTNLPLKPAVDRLCAYQVERSILRSRIVAARRAKATYWGLELPCIIVAIRLENDGEVSRCVGEFFENLLLAGIIT